ncbi:MAG: RNA polymerase-binding protein DksA [Ostreibacterium sp.]
MVEPLIEQQLPKQTIHHGDDYMDERQLAYFKDILSRWKISITEHNLNAKQKLQSDTSPLADLNDRASLEEEFSLTLRSRDRERKLVAKINAALNRIDTEAFGYCEKCGIEIGIARLEVRPTAELCIDCKEIEEKREKTSNT